MEKIDKVIAGLGCCADLDRSCEDCPYTGAEYCEVALMCDVLDHLTVYRDFLRRCGEGGELIRRSDVLKFPIRRDHYDREHGNPHFINGIETVMEYVEFIPPVEAEPVVRAHWVIERWSSGYIKRCSCSNCGNHPKDAYEPSKYCDNCGAHMDEELRTCYCPLCDKHFRVRSNDSHGYCPDCGRHAVLFEEEVAEDG